MKLKNLIFYFYILCFITACIKKPIYSYQICDFPERFNRQMLKPFQAEQSIFTNQGSLRILWLSNGRRAFILGTNPFGMVFELCIWEDEFLYLDFSSSSAYSNSAEILGENYLEISWEPENFQILNLLVRTLLGRLETSDLLCKRQGKFFKLSGKLENGKMVEYYFSQSGELVKMVCDGAVIEFKYQGYFFPSQIKIKNKNLSATIKTIKFEQKPVQIPQLTIPDEFSKYLIKAG